MKALYGKKVGMTRIFDETGRCIPVTVLSMTPNVVVQTKTEEKEGYASVQVGFGEQKPQRLNKAISGHIASAKHGALRHLREIRLDPDDADYQVGDEIKLEGMFESGELVDVIGVTQGKGFAGVIKRHGMKGAQTMTHGTHEYFRHGGSIGCRKFPGRVFKNKRMAGHMGNVRRIQERLKVAQVRADEHLLLIQGSVPGPKNGLVCVRSAVKARTPKAA